MSIGPIWIYDGHIWFKISIFFTKHRNTVQNIFGKISYFVQALIILTLNMQGLSYLGLTRLISCLLMPWLLASPGHQQPWYWLCVIDRPLSYLRKDFNTLVISFWRNDIKCIIYGYVSFGKFSKGLSIHHVSSVEQHNIINILLIARSLSSNSSSDLSSVSMNLTLWLI